MTTIDDIAAMKKPFIGAREASEATGLDRYTINLLGKMGKPWMGCKVHFTGKRQTKAVIVREEFLRAMHYEVKETKTNAI